MSRYSKNLSGQSEKVIVVPNTAKTAQSTYAAFVNSSETDGTAGFFLTNGNKTESALTSSDIFFIAQKRDGQVHRTPYMAWSDLARKVKTLSTTPIKQISSIGYNTTTTTNNIFPSTPFSAASATNTLTFGITVRETTPGNQPFPVQEGYATVNSSAADQYAVLSQIVSQLNFDLDYFKEAPDPFVIAEIQTNAGTAAVTGTATVLAVANKQKDATADGTLTNIAVGTYISISTAMYRVTAKSGNTITLDRPFTGASNATLAIANVLVLTWVNGTSLLGVRFTSILAESTFIVAGNTGLINQFTQTTTAFVLGAGYDTNIIELESREGTIFEGVGSTVNAKFAADYGAPVKFAVVGGTYDQYFIDFAVTNVPSSNPLDAAQKQMERVHLVIHSSSNLSAVAATVLGL